MRVAHDSADGRAAVRYRVAGLVLILIVAPIAGLAAWNVDAAIVVAGLGVALIAGTAGVDVVPPDQGEG